MTGKPGRPSKVRLAGDILAHAMDWRLKLAPCWQEPDVKRGILDAKNEQDVVAAFQPRGPYFRDRCTMGNLPRTILEAVHDRDFPKINEDAQVAFLADSLVAMGDVSGRRSRQIVRRERKKRGNDPNEYLPGWNRRQSERMRQALKANH